jgi:hypothetical protein
MNQNAARLAGTTKELAAQWQQTKESWRDSKSAEFESRFIHELLPSVDKAVTVIEQLDKLLAKIKRDCE